MARDIYILASAVAGLLADLSAEVQLAPEYDLSELSDERCVVVPVGVQSTRLCRNSKVVENRYQLEVGFLYRSKELKADELLSFTRSIADRLLKARADGLSCIKAEPNPLYDAEQIRERNQFTAVISLTYKEITS